MILDVNRTTTPGRGDQTRAALLEAAIEIFGRDGFHAASTRAIATEAGANQALIGYHFGGKQALYLAAFEMISARMSQHIRPVVDDISPTLERLQFPTSDQSLTQRRELCVQALHRLFSAVLELMGSAASAPWVRLILREQLDPNQAIEVMYSGVFGELLNLMTQLVCIAEGEGETPDSEAVRVRAVMLLGNALVFLIARGTTRMHLGWDELGDSEIAAIKVELLRMLRRQFLLENKND